MRCALIYSLFLRGFDGLNITNQVKYNNIQSQRLHSLSIIFFIRFVLPIMSCLLIIYFVGTRHSPWHTWVHHYFYLSFRQRDRWKDTKIHSFHYLQIHDVPMQQAWSNEKFSFIKRKTTKERQKIRYNREKKVC